MATARILRKSVYGNEQVLRARFSDARFFYQADIKQPLADYLPRLDTLTFQADLGSMRAKNDRVARDRRRSGCSAGIRSRGDRGRARGGACRQSRSGDQHGRRDDVFAGRHGARIRAARRHGPGGSGMRYANTGCRPALAIACPHPTPAGCWRWRTSSTASSG